MKLHLEPDTEGWKVIVQIPEKGKSLTVGHLRRLSERQWSFALTDKRYDFQAKDLDEARAHLTERLRINEGLPEILQDDTMSTLVFKELQLLNVLACRTESLKGWVSGIASGLGRFLVEDLPDGQEEVFWKQLREAAENVRDQIQQQEAAKGELETVLKHMHQAMQPTDEDPPPPVH